MPALKLKTSADSEDSVETIVSIHPLDRCLQEALEQKVFPGGSLLVQKGDQILWDKFYGLAQTTPRHIPLIREAIFDIASLNKPVCTATLCMLAYQEGTFSLADPIQKYFPEATHWTGVTLAHLMNHSSGLPAWRPYHEELLLEDASAIATDRGKEWLIRRILQEQLENPVGTKVVYSDLGYILLGVILEKIYGDRLENLFQERIAQPLGLKDTFFQPLDPHQIHLQQPQRFFAVTEKCPWRRKMLRGLVMDGSAYLMGGVAGHAGLFSTTRDLATWLNEIRKASRGEGKLIRLETFNLFCLAPENRDLARSFFTYGFDTRGLPSSTGDHFSFKTIGHLGFTGCSLWWDPTTDLSVILLTNRVHPSRKNDKIRTFRPRLHNLIHQTFIAA